MNMKVGIAILLCAIFLVLGASVSSIHYINNPKVVVKEVSVPFEVKVPVEVIKEVPVEIKVPVEVIKTIEDTTKITLVNDYLEDIDEDLTVEYVVFESKAKAEAEEYINSEMIELLKDEDYFDSVLDDYRISEVSVYKIYDAEVLSNDYEDLDVELSYEVKVKAKESGEDREYFMFNIVIPFEDSKIVIDDISVELI